MRQRCVCLAMAILVGGLAGALARDEEEKIALDKVPKAVLKVVKAKFKDAELVSAEKETKDKKVVYEISLKLKGKTVEVSATPDGKIISIEKTIAAKDLPKAVTETLESKYPKATIKVAEEIMEGEKLSYEVLLVTADKKTLEVVFDPKGKVVQEEKKDKED